MSWERKYIAVGDGMYEATTRHGIIRYLTYVDWDKGMGA